eukprot:2840231-Rhodomonas_salina.1
MRGNTELEDLSQRNTGGQDESERQNGPEAVDVVLRGGRLSGGWMLWKRVGFLMLGSVGWICITMVSSTVTMRAPCGVVVALQQQQPSPSPVIGIRGATTAENNTLPAIHDATYELVMAILKRNDLEPAGVLPLPLTAVPSAVEVLTFLVAQDVTEAFFTVTPDLTAAFAATPARTRVGVTAPLFGGVEAQVFHVQCLRLKLTGLTLVLMRFLSVDQDFSDTSRT